MGQKRAGILSTRAAENFAMEKGFAVIEKGHFGRGRDQSKNYTQVLNAVIKIYKKQKKKNLQEARLQYSKSKDIKFIIGGKKDPMTFIKSAQRWKYKSESLKTWAKKM